jgi:hypothetical protein
MWLSSSVFRGAGDRSGINCGVRLAILVLAAGKHWHSQWHTGTDKSGRTAEIMPHSSDRSQHDSGTLLISAAASARVICKIAENADSGASTAGRRICHLIPERQWQNGFVGCKSED